jgi:hypothetical protein
VRVGGLGVLCCGSKPARGPSLPPDAPTATATQQLWPERGPRGSLDSDSAASSSGSGASARAAPPATMVPPPRRAQAGALPGVWGARAGARGSPRAIGDGGGALFKVLASLDGAGAGTLLSRSGGADPAAAPEPSPCPLSPSRPCAWQTGSPRWAAGSASGAKQEQGAPPCRCSADPPPPLRGLRMAPTPAAPPAPAMRAPRSRRGAAGGIGSNGARRAPGAAALPAPGDSLGALAATLTGLGVQLERRPARPDALKPSVADIAAGINRTVSALARIATQLGDDGGGSGQARSAASSVSASGGGAAAAPPAPPGPDAAPGGAQDRGGTRRSPLKGASQEQLRQLRRELDRLNDTVLRTRRSGGAAALAARGSAEAAHSGGAEPAAMDAAAADTHVQRPQQQPQHQQQQQQWEPEEQQQQPAVPATGEGADCGAAVEDAARQLARLQAENRELRTHLGSAEAAASDLRQQLIGLQLAIDRNGGVDAGLLLLETQKLTRQLHAKEQALAAAHAALVAQSAQPPDARASELRARLREAGAQLRARDAALAAAEAELRELRAGRDQRRSRAVPAAASAAGVGARSDASLTSPDGSDAEGGAAAKRSELAAARRRADEAEAEAEERAAEAGALREQVSALQQRLTLLHQERGPRAARADSGASGGAASSGAHLAAGLPSLDEALQALARRAQEVAELRADAARCEERHAEALGAQEAAFERRLGVQQRLLEAAQAEVRLRRGWAGLGLDKTAPQHRAGCLQGAAARCWQGQTRPCTPARPAAAHPRRRGGGAAGAPRPRRCTRAPAGRRPRHCQRGRRYSSSRRRPGRLARREPTRRGRRGRGAAAASG